MREQKHRFSKYPGNMVHRSIYVDRDLWDKARVHAATKGKSLNELVNEYLWSVVYGQEAEKIEYNYQGLKKDFVKFVRETRRLVATLKDMGVYDELTGLAFKLGLKSDLSNVAEIIPKLTLEWPDEDSLIVFIDLLETSLRKREIAESISKAIAQKYLSRGGQRNAVQQTDASTHSVQGAGSVSEMREQRADEDSRPQVS